MRKTLHKWEVVFDFCSVILQARLHMEALKARITFFFINNWFGGL